MAKKRAAAREPAPAQIGVMGDDGRSVFLFAATRTDTSPEELQTWERAIGVHVLEANGAVATLRGLLSRLGLPVAYEPPPARAAFGERIAESVFELRRSGAISEAAFWEAGGSAGWFIERTVPTGVPRDELYDHKQVPAYVHATPTLPCVIIDYRQGFAFWVAEPPRAHFLANRALLVRTHDPCLHPWQQLRQDPQLRAVWSAPLSDLASGALDTPGLWPDLEQRVAGYLKRDATLWRAGHGWLHTIVINVDIDGALVFPAGHTRTAVVRRPGSQLGSSARAHRGQVLGKGSLLLASLARWFAQSHLAAAQAKRSAKPEDAAKLEDFPSRALTCAQLDALRSAIVTGLIAAGRNKVQGHARPPLGTLQHPEDGMAGLFSEQALAALGTQTPAGHSTTDSLADWSWAPTTGRLSTHEVTELVRATETSMRAQLALQFGKLNLVDPDHARSLLHLEHTLKDFLRRCRDEDVKDTKQRKDLVLSLALFGGPGSGKSFLAEQLRDAVDPHGTEFARDHMTLNLSQFQSPEQLGEALEQVRTAGLGRRVPFVLWDEFDTAVNGEAGAWLSRFLVPMQDRTFYRHGRAHPLGHAVFVFIGGTFTGEADLQTWTQTEAGRRAKAPDFHSRLTATLTAPSVASHPDLLDGRERASDGIATAVSRANRAVILRRQLRSVFKNLTHIERGVLSLLLHVPTQHGVRSLEKLLEAAHRKEAHELRAAQLPGPGVLEVHVDHRFWRERVAHRASASSPLHALISACCAGDADPYELLPVHKEDQ
jgi:hypothetical protein